NGIAQGNALGEERHQPATALKGRNSTWGIAPFQGWTDDGPLSPGRCPGLFHCAPAGLKTSPQNTLTPATDTLLGQGTVPPARPQSFLRIPYVGRAAARLNISDD